MKARLAQKILKAKSDYQDFSRYDFPYTGQQLYAAGKRAGIPYKYRKSYSSWSKVSKIEGIEEVKSTFGYKLPTYKQNVK